jgi:glutamate-ammonia-ligase adenylyltransferase
VIPSCRQCFQKLLSEENARLLASAEWVRVLSEVAPLDCSPLAPAVARAAAFSPFFAETMVRDPQVFPDLLDSQAIRLERTAADLVGLLERDGADFDGKDATRRALSRLKRRELLRIGVREFAGLQDIAGQCRELSALAETAIEVALRESLAELTKRHGTPSGSGTDVGNCGFTVVAMGKLGARELNFSSDLDLLYVYSTEGETTGIRSGSGELRGRITNHHFYSELGSAITRFLSEATVEGTLFRIDLRLRPEGNAGAVARSILGYEAYFAQQARAWEKVAYLKARPVTGDERVANLFAQLVQAFVYEENTPDTLLPEVARLKGRIDAEAQKPRDGGYDLKRGPGGIREIEFLATAQQLLHGGRDKSLRMRETTPALERLAATGRITEENASRHIRTYWFYRRVEHALQMVEEKQTHALPPPGPEADRLANALDFSSWTELDERLSQDRTFVREAFEVFFGTAKPKGAQALADFLETGKVPPDFLLMPLREVGLAHPEGLAALRVLAVGTREVAIRSQGQKRFEELLPHLLRELHHAAIPAGAVHNLTNFMRAHWSITTLYDLLLAHPPVLRLLIRLLGFGALPARLLIAHPERFDEMLESDVLRPHTSPAASFEKRVGNRLGSLEPDAAIVAIREWKERESLYCAAREILGILEVDDAAAHTTEVAECCLRGVAGIIERAQNPQRRWCILAMGGFGGRQVHLCADLDIACFVESDTPQMPGRNHAEVFFSTVISTMSAVSPHGSLWKMDARLRPEGVNGPLAVPLDRAERYYAGEAGTWEFQSATRARFVAGDPSLAEDIFSILRAATDTRAKAGGLAGEVRAMRARLESSLKLPSHAECDLKRSPGGLVDIEFLVQYLLLHHSTELGDSIVPCTRDAIDRLMGAGFLSEADGLFIEEQRKRLRTLQRTLRLLRESSRDFIPINSTQREELTRAIAFQDASPRDLLQRLPDDMRRMREVFERVVADPA